MGSKALGAPGGNGDTAPLNPPLFGANALQSLQLRQINPTHSTPRLHSTHRSAGEQSDPCSNRCASVVIEREVLSFPPPREGRGQGAGRNTEVGVLYN